MNIRGWVKGLIVGLRWLTEISMLAMKVDQEVILTHRIDT